MSTAHRLQGRTDDRGSMAVEVVVLVPVMLMVLALVVAMGRYVHVQGAADAAAREAVRSASLERDVDSARDAARAAASASLPASLDCDPADLSGDFVAGGVVQVRLDCQVTWSDLGLVGLPGSAGVSGTGAAPIDRYRGLR